MCNPLVLYLVVDAATHYPRIGPAMVLIHVSISPDNWHVLYLPLDAGTNYAKIGPAIVRVRMLISINHIYTDVTV